MKKIIVLLAILSTVSLIGCTKDTKTNESTNVELTERQQVVADYKATQAETDKALKKELKGNYTFEKPFVTINPYNISALTAMVGFETKEETKVSVVIKGKDKNTNITHSFEVFSKEHLIPIYGLYADFENSIDITITDKNGTTQTNTISIKTDPLPSDISKINVKKAVPEQMVNGLTFVDCPHVNGNYCLALDSNGDIRWYLGDKSLNGCVMMTHLKNGNILIGSADIIPNSYNNITVVHELTLLGKFVNDFEVYGIHHDIREKSNGNLIFAASEEGTAVQNDYIVEIDRKTGKEVNSWNLTEIIPMTEYDTQPPYSGGLNNWIHNNAVWYIEDEDAFIISGRHQNMVMKLDAKTSKIKWILSETVGNLNEKLRPYLLTPITENGQEFEYPTSQHAAMQTPEGYLMLFDNRNIDEQNEDGTLAQEKLYSRAVQYEIDEENMTVKQIWQYGKERGGEIFSSFVSDVDYLSSNHYLIDFGGMYKLDDGSNYDHVLTAKDLKNSSNKQSTIIELKDNEVIFEALLYGNANSNTYKAERKNIYLNATEIKL